MAVINCPECGKEISDTVIKCPNCGYSINKLRLDFTKICLIGGVLSVFALYITILSFPGVPGWGVYIDPVSPEFYKGCVMFLCGLAVLF